MNKIFKRGMTVLLAVILLFSSIDVMAAWSPEYAKSDYRDMEIRTKDNKAAEKPTAQFAVKRISDGEMVDKVVSYSGYDCGVPFPTIVCYVGDKITFEDLSHDNNPGGKLVEWDWQRFGAMGDHYMLYNYNILQKETLDCTQPGETIFYLSVKNNLKVKTGFCDPWSENGNHQIKGSNKWFPKGAYWYFTAVRVVVLPVSESVLNVRYWDTSAGRIIHTDVLTGPILKNDEQTTITAQLSAPKGFFIKDWNVQLPDGTIEYYGSDLTTDISLSGYTPQKNLNVECYLTDTGIGGKKSEVGIKYVDSKSSEVISETKVEGDYLYSGSVSNVEVSLEAPDGYNIDHWDLTLDNGVVEKQGVETNFTVTLNHDVPNKTVIVLCNSKSGGGGPTSDPDVPIVPDEDCAGFVEWTETASHQVPDGHDSNGNRTYRKCNHKFKYRAVLNANAEITPDTLKSGYGFGVEIRYSISKILISNSGGCRNWGNNRSATKIVKAPTSATVYLPWTMTNNFGTQGNRISMEKSGSTKFILPKSRVSSIDARKIYTPVELAGTEEAPVSHSFEMYINGGGVGSTEFCKKLVGTITINGVMYDDDFSGAD